MSVTDVLPPSPPTTSSRTHHVLRHTFPLSSPTPVGESPVSGFGSSDSSRKRVEFSPWTNAHDPHPFTPSSDKAAAIKTLPPSRECQAAPKSILKQFQDLQQDDHGMDGQQDAQKPADETMESIAQQLGCGDRNTKIDAYSTLVSLIRAYNEVPEAAVLKNKLSAITRYIRRDLTAADKVEADPLETNLITHALKALAVLVWHQDFSPYLTDDFRGFVIDRSIYVLHEHKAPKSVVVHYLHMLATQDFRPCLIASNNRATRLLEALSGLTEHYTGNGVASERLMVYCRLLDQARPAMQSRAVGWLRDMSLGLMSSVTITRTRAMLVGKKACSPFPSTQSISIALREVLSTEYEGGPPIGAYLCRRLDKMVVAKEDSVQVPEIWTVIILLVGGLRERIDEWPSYKDWLKVIQRCFNCSNAETRAKANVAWNRFVSVVRPHQASEILISTLTKPILAQLLGPEKHSKSSRAYAVSSYCNLLYYAFRPAANHKQHTHMWNEYIVKVMTSSFMRRSTANADLACRVLTSLLWSSGSTTKVWKEHRAHENALMTPEELPSLDCKWVRAKAEAVLRIFELLLEYSSWGLGSFSDQAFIAQAWSGFSKAIRESLCREIKLSTETKTALQHIVNFLQGLDSNENTEIINAKNSQDFSERLHFLCRSFVASVGITPILETGSESLMSSTTFANELLTSALSSVAGSQTSTGTGTPSSKMAALDKLLAHIETDLKTGYASSDAKGSILRPFRAAVSSIQIATATSEVLGLLCLRKLQLSLGIWLEDREQRFMSDTEFDVLATKIISILGNILPTDLESFDGILAASLSSSHMAIVNSMITLWSEKLSQADIQIHPPLLKAALQRLKPFVELELPGLSQNVGQLRDIQSILAAVKAASERTGSPTLQEKIRAPLCGKTGSLAEDKTPEKSSEPTLVEAKSRSPARIDTPKARPHHNNTQVNFITIDSSPMVVEAPESQYLTDRQKEIRERQSTEPALALYSRKWKTAALSTDSPNNARALFNKSEAAIEPPSTPELPTNCDDEEVAMSPTPKAKQRPLRLEEIEFISSPAAADEKRSSGAREAPSSTSRVRESLAGLLEILSTANQPTTQPAYLHQDHTDGDDGATMQGNHKPQSSLAEISDQAQRNKDDANIMAMPQIRNAPLSDGNCHSDDMEDTQSWSAPVNDEMTSDKRIRSAAYKAEPLSAVAATEDTVNENIEDEAQPEIADGGVQIAPYEYQDGDAQLDGCHRVPDSGEEMNICSDEIDELSASQLSNDLDCYITATHPTPEKMATSVKRHVSDEEPESRQGKRRKTSARSRTKPTPPRVEFAEIAEEIYDCVEVNTSGQAKPTDPPKKPTSSHRRPSEPIRSVFSRARRSRSRKVTSITPSTEMSYEDEESATLVKIEEAERDNPEISRLSQEARASSPTSLDNFERKHSSPDGQQHPSESGEEDILASLRQVLLRLKQARPEEVDLREIDDLCFEIRTEAQNAAQRADSM